MTRHSPHPRNSEKRSWNTVWAVIEREFMTRVKSRAFILATLATPLLVAGFFGLVVWLNVRDQGETPALAIVDETGVLYGLLEPRLDQIGYEAHLVAEADTDPEALDARVTGGNLTGYLRLDEETLNRGTATYRSTDGLSRLRRVSLAGAVAQSALEARLGGEQADMAALLTGGAITIDIVSSQEEEGDNGGGSPVFAFLGSFLLYMALLLYGSQILRAILEEKNGRIVEIILSSMKPWEFLLGKIVGVGAVGLLQIGIWIGFLMLLVLAVLPALPVAAAALPDAISVSGMLPGPGEVAFFAVCFVLGYLMYASVFAVVGALNSNETDAQQMMWPVIILVMIPMMTLGPVLDDPDATWAMWLSQVPLFSPILMFARVVVGAPAFWEVGLSLVLLAAGVWGMAVLAGKIYRVGILMQGKRPTLPEVWRWVRQP